MAETYEQLKPLFSGADAQGKYNDDRVKLFVHFLLKANTSNNLINGFNNTRPNETPGDFDQFMIVKNFNNAPANSRDTDISQEILPFVQDMARYHRALDAPSAGNPGGANMARQAGLISNIQSCAMQDRGAGGRGALLVPALTAVVNAVAAVGGAAVRAQIQANGGSLNPAIIGAIDALVGGNPLVTDLRDVMVYNMEQNCTGGAVGSIPAARADLRDPLLQNLLIQNVMWGPRLNPGNAGEWAAGQPNVPVPATVVPQLLNASKAIIVQALQRVTQGTQSPLAMGNNQQQALQGFLVNNWNSLTPTAKNFYETFLNLVDTRNANARPIADIVNLSPMDLQQLRINFKTTGAVGAAQNNIIGNIMPRLGTWTRGVWTSANNFTNQGALPGGADYLVNQYVGTLQNAGLPAYVAPTSRKFFSYNVDEFFRALLADSMQASTSTPGAGVSAILLQDDANADVYGRNTQGKLVKNVNGQMVDVSKGSSYYNQQATVANNCMTTGVVPGTYNGVNLTCNNYIVDCLAGNNIQDCQAYFNSTDFWDRTSDEVQNMLPSVAIDTLNRFGFKQQMKFDSTANRDLVKVQDVNSWLQGLDSVTNDNATKQSIRGNMKLKAYLEALVTVVNANPAILNNNYSGASQESSPNRPRVNPNSPLARFGLKARYPVSKSSQRDVEMLASAINRNNIVLSLRLGVPMFGTTVPMVLMGGGSDGAVQIETATAQLRDTNKYPSSIFKGMFDYYVEKLKVNQKDISPKDKQAIDALITDLHKRENKLYEVMNFIEKYSILVSLFGENQSQQVVTVTDMKKAVDARKNIFNKKVKRENDLVSVLRTMVQAVVNETQSPGQSGPMMSVGTGANL